MHFLSQDQIMRTARYLADVKQAPVNVYWIVNAYVCRMVGEACDGELIATVNPPA